ncbi:Fic family protein [Microbacterium esteraromaticum]|uniref:Fic family protein n=1 Tax=Microbacterium esteraromaticum TaxID=57043 RepID=UPI002367ACC0|nr:Fic family protein [Microbacterium esteraromaticum]WDH78803.1 Fic family protein [Microbacterium esteraromaticum]
MRATDFTSSRFGEIKKDPIGPWPHPYFLPASIPRQLPLEADTVAAVARASTALGQLSGFALLVNDPELLLGPSMAQEALASSRIEGTEASLSEVLSSANDDVLVENENLREVSNYLKAATQGITLLETWPFTQCFFCALHETLLTGTRGEEKFPGDLRRSPVWIGSPNARPETAKFIPPLPSELGALLDDWEHFANDPSTMPAVVRAALTHYQFETIHPFLDGNGRIGRLLIGFQLMNEGVLPAPVLHISGYFESHRPEYYQRLQAVRERGEIEEWVMFFCAAVEDAAARSSARIRALLALRETYRTQARTERSSLPALIDAVFRNPVITVSTIMDAAGLSQPGASKLIHKAEARGWVTSVGRWGRGGKERWLAKEVWAAVTDGADFDEEDTK